MNIDPKHVKPGQSRGGEIPQNDRQQGQDTGREGGDDALSAAPTDARLDEKVIVNEQAGNKVTNAPDEVFKNSVAKENDDKI
jgi:hypothetical protein